MQLDQAAGPGSWVMGITAVVCLRLCLMSCWRGERVFPWYEWAFLLAAAVSVLGIRPDRDQGMGAAA